MRPQMIPLSELVPDANWPSTIGNAHGDIYETQFETAVNSRMNYRGGKGVPEVYYSHMRPVIQAGKEAMAQAKL